MSETHTATILLTKEDPAPVKLRNMEFSSPYLLVCDHAGRKIPQSLGDMGVPASDWNRHIAWDIGIAEVARHISDFLKAPLVEQAYSRLVIDCNRKPGHRGSIPEVSDGTIIPANKGLSAEERHAREEGIFWPYHQAIEYEADIRGTIILIALHSFTPVYQQQERPWHLGVLHNRNPVFALEFIKQVEQLSDGPWIVGSNEPYILTDENDYTIPRHAEASARPYLELEIRQDLIDAPEGQRLWAARIAEVIEKTRTALSQEPSK
ncbi:N-formylglutamate amidohydrolase [Entomobacter blattae]|uniref:N-formylglutamate amidohydrolase n=1 Tax=Entomobacter blattae TaxID=2762277 RepID=A0A7H1NSA8_9PROT|nr:N-formylglutamate amidohydrolase [Entomobacter blattae]QNT78668.1 N-formylglutamate amidohydrolase [Entomobacter blattae]